MENLTEIFLLKFFGLKVIIATVCGFIVGLERELKDKVAGIRTNVLICVGVTIITAASILYSQIYSNIDFTRIIGQIVTGIGFLGSGVIFKSDNRVVGMTTAAFIWIMSAIGILIGSGIYILPIILTVGIVIMSVIFQELERKIKKNNHSGNSESD